jgi:uncharacterized protein (DUF1800 family)
MKSIHQAARKIGFGFRSDDRASKTSDTWIEEQLSLEPNWLVLKSNNDEARELVHWPNEPDLSLGARVNRLRLRRSVKEEIDAKKLSDSERDVLLEKNWDENSVSPMDQLLFLQAAIYSADQVKLRLSHFWLNHFTVGDKETTSELIGDYWKNAIYNNMNGSFNEMLYHATSHPAMLTYLDNIYNIGPNSEKAAECRAKDCVVGINDNLGRELLELHTVSARHGYTEADIHEAAKVLTGWGNIIDRPFNQEPEDYSQPWEGYHAEPGTKTVLGKVIPSGSDGLRVLTDYLADDLSTARHLSLKLARHFVGESVSSDDVASIEKVWVSTRGYLPAVHQEVLRLAVASDIRKFHWPLTWAVQVLRISGGDLFEGHEDQKNRDKDAVLRDAGKFMAEIGNSFWSVRQPNGFSDRKADWISTEHMDRRIRFAGLVYDHARGRRSVDELLETLELTIATRELVARGKSDTQRFILLMCSPEMMEV